MVNFFQKNEITWVNPKQHEDKIQLQTPLDNTLQRRELENPHLSIYCVLAWYERYQRFQEPLPPPSLEDSPYFMSILTQDDVWNPKPKPKPFKPHYDIFFPRIVFHKHNMKAVYDSIPPEIRGDANYHKTPLIHNAGLWAIMTNCIFYHELGHHLVQLFTERPDNKGVKRTNMDDEQKLCEYIAFKKMHEKLTTKNSLILPSKYTKENETDAVTWTDIGDSEIYRSRMSKNNVMKGINSVNNTNFTNTQASKILNWILAAFGGRGKGEIYHPEITTDTQTMIDTDPDIWEQLYDLIYNDDSEYANPYGIEPIPNANATSYNGQYRKSNSDWSAGHIIHKTLIMSYESKQYSHQSRPRW